MKILLVGKLGRNSMTLKLNISLRPFDLLCMSAQKLGFSSFDCFFLFFSLNCFNLHNSEKITNGPGAWKLCRMKRLHRFCPGGPELSRVKLCIKCDYPVLDMWFSQKHFWHPCIKRHDAAKQSERERIILLSRVGEDALRAAGPRSAFPGTKVGFCLPTELATRCTCVVNHSWGHPQTLVWSDPCLLVKFLEKPLACSYLEGMPSPSASPARKSQTVHQPHHLGDLK